MYCINNRTFLFLIFIYTYTGSAKYLIFLENLKKKTTEYFLKFLFFYFKVQSFQLIMEKSFIQMAASAGHTAVANYRLCAAVLHQLLHEYYLWIVSITLIFDGSPEIIVQRCQIAALRLIMRSSKTGRKTSSVASAV